MASGSGEADRAARERDAAVADALEDGARVLMRLAARLRATAPAGDAPGRAAHPAVPTASAGRSPRTDRLGDRQAAVLTLGGLDDELGLAASEVAKALGYTAPNATNILKRLEDLGHVQRVPGERPARWRRVAA